MEEIGQSKILPIVDYADVESEGMEVKAEESILDSSQNQQVKETESMADKKAPKEAKSLVGLNEAQMKAVRKLRAQMELATGDRVTSGDAIEAACAKMLK